MKLQNVIALCLLVKSCVCFAQSVQRPIQIVIDPGHGGVDSGAIGKTGVLEKDLVLQIAKQLTRKASSFDHKPATYYLTRYSDTLISLGDRADLAKRLKADLFISLHINDAPEANAQGIEVYVYDGPSRYREDSVWLAYRIQEKLAAKTRQKKRGVKFADFQVLRDLSDSCPAVLVELEFINRIFVNIGNN